MRPLALDRDLFDDLAAREGSDLISMLIPTHTKGRDVSQDRIRLKNLLASADSELDRLGFKPRERRDRLQFAQELLEDREFWEHQAKGLAVYVDDDGRVTPVSLTRSVGESAVIMSVFLMRPLLTALTGPEIPALALTRGEVGLFLVSASSARRAGADLPESFDDVNWFVDRERQRQQHPDRSGTGRARHGHDPADREDEDLSRFLREVDQALPESEMMIVLGDDDLVSRFEHVSDRRVLSSENSGLRAPFTESEILDKADPIVDEVMRDRERDALAGAEEQIGVGNATTDISVAMRGAMTGRIGQLIVDPTMDPIWGRVDASTLEVTAHDEREHADVDLVDRVVVLAMRHGAEVTPVTGQTTDSQLVAVTRF